MAWQGYWSRGRNAPLLAKTCDPKFLSRPVLPALSDHGGESCPLCTISKSGLLDSRSVIRVTQRSIRGSHSSGLAPCLLLMLMDWAIAQMHSLTLLSIRCVVKPPLSCQIPTLSAAHWLTPTPAFLAKTGTWGVGIWMLLAFAMTDFGNQKVSHYIWGSQGCSIIEWWISNASHSEQGLEELNISSRVMRYGSRGEKGVSKVLEIVSKVGKQGEYIWAWRVFLIRQHHLGCNSASRQFT